MGLELSNKWENWSNKLGEDHNSWKMANRDNELKVLRTSTYNTTQYGCKSNINKTHSVTLGTSCYTKLMRTKMLCQNIPKLNDQNVNN
jgi:hypothetical protein